MRFRSPLAARCFAAFVLATRRAGQREEAGGPWNCGLSFDDLTGDLLLCANLPLLTPASDISGPIVVRGSAYAADVPEYFPIQCPLARARQGSRAPRAGTVLATLLSALRRMIIAWPELGVTGTAQRARAMHVHDRTRSRRTRSRVFRTGTRGVSISDGLAAKLNHRVAV